MNNRRGQAILLTLLVIGGMLLAATTIAGLLVVFQLRQSSDVVNATKAIFAADSGIELGLYRYFGGVAENQTEFLNSATFKVSCSPGGDCASASTTVIKSLGISGNVARALELTL